MCPKCRSLRWSLPKDYNPYKGLPKVPGGKR
jgi:hypothetical protein